MCSPICRVLSDGAEVCVKVLPTAFSYDAVMGIWGRSVGRLLRKCQHCNRVALKRVIPLRHPACFRWYESLRRLGIRSAVILFLAFVENITGCGVA